MGTFREYYNESLGQSIKGLFNSEYAALNQMQRNYFDRLTPQARAEVMKIKSGQQIPLVKALQIYISELEQRNQLDQWTQQMPPERKIYGAKPYGNDTHGWKRF